MGKSLTTEVLFQDLKQFIRAEISGSEKNIVTELRAEFRSELRQELGSLRDDLTDQINESASEVMRAVTESAQPVLDNHERRITLLKKSGRGKIPTLRH